MTTDALFATIEAWHQGRPSASVLDAGTGRHSLGWLVSWLNARITAVTADPRSADAMSSEFPRAEVILGRWTDERLLAGRTFDVVVADYLLGAVDGFTPYAQDALFPRLRAHVGGRLYVVGLEPWPDRAEDPDAQAFLELCRLRDAAFLVSGARPYREYPETWVVNSLEQSGFRVVERARMPILHSVRTIDREHGNLARTVGGLADRALATALLAGADALRTQLLGRVSRRKLLFGADYLIAAERST